MYVLKGHISTQMVGKKILLFFFLENLFLFYYIEHIVSSPLIAAFQNSSSGKQGFSFTEHELKNQAEFKTRRKSQGSLFAFEKENIYKQ